MTRRPLVRWLYVASTGLFVVNVALYFMFGHRLVNAVGALVSAFAANLWRRPTDATVRDRKRSAARLARRRRRERRATRRREWRCWWTWPLGHRYQRVPIDDEALPGETPRRPASDVQVRVCVGCRRPYGDVGERFDAGWQKAVEPPPPGSRPGSLPPPPRPADD